MKSLASVLFAAFLSFAFIQGVLAQNVPPAPDANTVHVVTTVDVSPASAAQALAALRRYRDAARAGAGNSGAEVLQGATEPHRFAVTEQWRDRMAYDAYKAGAASAQLAQALGPIQTAAPQSDLFRSLVVGAQNRPGAGRNVHAISRFAIIPARAADYGEMASALGVASRAETGVVRYDIVQGLDANKDKFAILELWSTPQQHETHRTSAHVTRFRDQVALLLDSTIAETIYNRVN